VIGAAKRVIAIERRKAEGDAGSDADEQDGCRGQS
jgi:hypothetical protein